MLEKPFIMGVTHLLIEILYTLPRNEFLCQLFGGALVAMNFIYNEGLEPMAVEKIKILGSVLELPAQQCQFSPFC